MSFLFSLHNAKSPLNRREQKLVDRKSKKAERLLLEIQQVIGELKKQIMELNQTMETKMEAATQCASLSRRSSTVKTLLSLQRVGLMEDKRKSLMLAIEYLQDSEIGLLSQIQEITDHETARGKTTAALSLQLPDLEEITLEVQRILTVEQTTEESHQHHSNNVAKNGNHTHLSGGRDVFSGNRSTDRMEEVGSVAVAAGKTSKR